MRNRAVVPVPQTTSRFPTESENRSLVNLHLIRHTIITNLERSGQTVDGRVLPVIIRDDVLELWRHAQLQISGDTVVDTVAKNTKVRAMMNEDRPRLAEESTWVLPKAGSWLTLGVLVGKGEKYYLHRVEFGVKEGNNTLSKGINEVL